MGGCSSGKSNLIEFFKFLKDYSENFQKGIKNHGDLFLQNFRHFHDNQVSHIKVFFENNKNENHSFTFDNEEIYLNFNKFSYDAEINFEIEEFSILKEIIEFSFDIIKYNDNGTNQVLSNNSILLKNDLGKITANLSRPEKYFTIDNLIPKQLLNIVENNYNHEQIPIINSALASIPFPWMLNFEDMIFYDFNPKIVKGVYKINGIII